MAFRFEYRITAKGFISVWCDGRAVGLIRETDKGYQYRPAGPGHAWGEAYVSLKALKADLEAE